MDLDREWTEYERRDELIREVGNPDLARGIFYGVGSNAFAWLDAPIPALGGRTPRACLRSRKGRTELGKLIARFPR